MNNTENVRYLRQPETRFGRHSSSFTDQTQSHQQGIGQDGHPEERAIHFKEAATCIARAGHLSRDMTKRLYIVDVSLHGSALVYAEDGERAMDLAADHADDIFDSTDVDADIRVEIDSTAAAERFRYKLDALDRVYHSGEEDILLRNLLPLLDERKRQRDIAARQLHLFTGKPSGPVKA